MDVRLAVIMCVVTLVAGYRRLGRDEFGPRHGDLGWGSRAGEDLPPPVPGAGGNKYHADPALSDPRFLDRRKYNFNYHVKSRSRFPAGAGALDTRQWPANDRRRFQQPSVDRNRNKGAPGVGVLQVAMPIHHLRPPVPAFDVDRPIDVVNEEPMPFHTLPGLSTRPHPPRRIPAVDDHQHHRPEYYDDTRYVACITY
jgi:hypothetical protein